MRKSWIAAVGLVICFFVLTGGHCGNDNNVTGPMPTATRTAVAASPTATGTSVPTSTPTTALTSTPTVTPNSLAAAFAGNWTGQWVNNTFGSMGSAGLTVAVNTSAQTFQTTLTLGGNVFGAGTPPPQTFNGTYTSSGATLTQTSSLFGNLTLTISPSGSFTGNATNVPNPNISRMDFTGTGTSQKITINYTITFTAAAGGGTAVGVLTLNHVS